MSNVIPVTPTMRTTESPFIALYRTLNVPNTEKPMGAMTRLRERITIPGGARDPRTGAGWARHRNGTTWEYRDPSAAHGGIRAAIVPRPKLLPLGRAVRTAAKDR